MDLEINVLGDGAYVLAVLNAVSGFTQAEYGTLGAIGMLLGMLLMMLKGIMEPGGPKFAPQTLLISIVIFWVMFIPRVDRVIVAEVTVRPGEAAPRSFVVDNVPLGLAGAGYLISNLGVQITKAYETGFGSAEDTERGTTGGLGRNLALMGQLRTMVSDPRFYDPPEGEDRSVINTFRTNMTEYMGQCTLPQVEARNLAPEKIFSEPGISGVVNDITANPVSAMVWTDINGAVETITCMDAAGRISSTYENGNELEGAFNRAMQASGSEIESDDVVEAFANYANSSGISMQRMMATMMVNSVASEAAVRSSLSPADTQAIIMVEEAAQRRNVQWAGEESLFIRILRPIVGFFEALFYALAPIMAFICTLGPMGWKLMGKYTMLTIWVGLWFPMLSLTQLYSNIEMRYFFDTLGNGGDYSPDQLTKIATEAMDTLGTASALTAATPALAMSLIYGGAVSMSYLAGRLQGSDHIDEGKVAPKASDVGAIANTQSAIQQSMYGGATRNGAVDQSYNFKSQLENSEQLTKQAQKQAAESFMQAYGQQTGSNIGFSVGGGTRENYVEGTNLKNAFQDSFADETVRQNVTSSELALLNEEMESGKVHFGIEGSTPVVKIGAGYRQEYAGTEKLAELEKAASSYNEAIKRSEGLQTEFGVAAAKDVAHSIGTDATNGFSASDTETLTAAASAVTSTSTTLAELQAMKTGTGYDETILGSQIPTKVSGDQISDFRSRAVALGIPVEQIEAAESNYRTNAGADPRSSQFAGVYDMVSNGSVAPGMDDERAALLKDMTGALFATSAAMPGYDAAAADEMSATNVDVSGANAAKSLGGPSMGRDEIANRAAGQITDSAQAVRDGGNAMLGNSTAQTAQGMYGLDPSNPTGEVADKGVLAADAHRENQMRSLEELQDLREKSNVAGISGALRGDSASEENQANTTKWLGQNAGDGTRRTNAEVIDTYLDDVVEYRLAEETGGNAVMPAGFADLPVDVRNATIALANTNTDVANAAYLNGSIGEKEYLDHHKAKFQAEIYTPSRPGESVLGTGNRERVEIEMNTLYPKN